MDTDAPAKQTELATLLGVSEAAVSGWVKRGTIRSGDSLGEQLRALFEYQRAQAAGRLEDPGIAEQRRELLFAKRQLAELDLAERKGQLVNAADVRTAVHAAARTARNVILDWPTRIGALLAAESDSLKVHEILTRECRLLCAAIADDAKRVAEL